MRQFKSSIMFLVISDILVCVISTEYISQIESLVARAFSILNYG